MSSLPLGALGCGGAAALESEGSEEAAGQAELPSTRPICDGSDDVRFVAGRGGGRIIELTSIFAATPFGDFITIDGRCNFWLFDGGVEGLRTGVLDADFARELSRELHFGGYAVAPAYSGYACPDAGQEGIWDGTGLLTDSRCGFREDAPRVWVEAFERVDELWGELASRGEPAWKATSILPLSGGPPPETRPAFEWTASFDLAANAMSYAEYTSGIVPTTLGVLVRDDETLALLAELRLATMAAIAQAKASYEYEPFPPGLFVRDAQTRYFQVLFRDEPPEAVANAIRFAWQ